MIEWRFCRFSDLDTTSLYQLLQLRQQVFVVEQDCAYLDADGQDYKAYHLIATANKKLVASLRVIPAEQVESAVNQTAIGRLVVDADYRGQGLAKQAMQKAVEYIRGSLAGDDGEHIIYLSGQVYLRRFYTELGFKPRGEVYLEDGIEHQRFEL